MPGDNSESRVVHSDAGAGIIARTAQKCGVDQCAAGGIQNSNEDVVVTTPEDRLIRAWRHRMVFSRGAGGIRISGRVHRNCRGRSI